MVWWRHTDLCIEKYNVWSPSNTFILILDFRLMIRRINISWFFHLLAGLLIYFFPWNLYAQSPEKFSYQAIIRNTVNNLVTNQPVGMRLSILQGSAAGASVFTETHSAVTDQNGLVTVEVGAGTPVLGTLSAINWSAGPYFLKTEIDPLGGTTYTMTGTSQFLSVPYALYAKTADYNNLSNKPVLDGSETKITAGTAVAVTGTGTIATPYQANQHTQSLTWAQREAITSPSAGHFVWCNDCGPVGEAQVFNGTVWTNIAGGAALPQWPPSAGDLYLGGVVAYVFIAGDPGYVAGEYHGLIAAGSDLSSGSPWGCWGVNLPGAGGSVLGTGNQNTIDIITTCVDAGTAARISYDLSLNGYSDWFLPSRDELLKLYDNRLAIGGFSATDYWSSTESLATNAFVVNFSTGANSGIPKTSNKSVRPIRYF
jgi:hypothetical protein